MNNKKGFVAMLLIAILAIIGIGVFVVSSNKKLDININPIPNIKNNIVKNKQTLDSQKEETINIKTTDTISKINKTNQGVYGTIFINTGGCGGAGPIDDHILFRNGDNNNETNQINQNNIPKCPRRLQKYF